MTPAANPTMIHVRAPGKINVFLKVGALLDDGYHDVAIAYQAVVDEMARVGVTSPAASISLKPRPFSASSNSQATEFVPGSPLPSSSKSPTEPAPLKGAPVDGAWAGTSVPVPSLNRRVTS